MGVDLVVPLMIASFAEVDALDVQSIEPDGDGCVLVFDGFIVELCWPNCLPVTALDVYEAIETAIFDAELKHDVDIDRRHQLARPPKQKPAAPRRRARRWEVWMEGYAATGESSPAKYCGSYRAESFREAASFWVAEHGEQQYFDETGPSYWGCRFFDNETDARGGFG